MTLIQPIGDEAFEILRDLYSYDDVIPLDTTIVERVEDTDHVREKIVFRGPRDTRVPGYLALPRNATGPCRPVMLIHGIGGSKDGWWTEARSPSRRPLIDRLLRDGRAVLTLDCEYHGERIARNDHESPAVFLFERGWIARARDMVMQSVVEHRRALDVLATRADIDLDPEGDAAVVGSSMGGLLAFILAAVEPRIRTTVAAVTPILDDPRSAITVHHYAPRIDHPFRMLMAERDRANYTEESARTVHGLLGSGTKAITFHDSEHELPPAWLDETGDWIDAHLAR